MNNHKRILHVNQYGCCKGGTENYVREIAAHLKEYDHYLLYEKEGDEKYLDAFKDSMGALKQGDEHIAHAMREIAPHHVIIYNIGNLGMGVFFDLRSELGFRITKSFHDYRMIYVGTGYNRMTLQRHKNPIGLHSILGCVTRDAFTRRITFENIWRKRKLLREVNNVDCVEVHTIDMKEALMRNGISPRHIYINPPWAAIPAESSAEPEADMFAFVGNLIRGKGLYLLLRALKKVRVSYVLKVAGDGYQRRALERYAARQRINTVFLGHIPRGEMGPLYSSSRFVVFPSIFEPFGFVIVEAMSYKRPVIAFDTGGTRELIQDGVNGYLIKPFDLNNMADKIEELLKDVSRAMRMGHKGYELFLSRFTLERHLSRLRTKLSELEA